MYVDFLKDTFKRLADQDALVWLDRAWRYGELLSAVENWERRLDQEQWQPGSVVSLEADFSPQSVALLLALIERSSVIVPLTRSVEGKKAEFREIAEIERIVALDDNDRAEFTRCDRVASHPLIAELRRRGHPGLVLFSSGSTGKSKGAIHDFVPLIEKFRVPRHRVRAITFLLFDHIGGINTLLYGLANGGCTVTVQDRSPDAICRAVERYRVELLPTSPTFLNLLLISKAYQKYDLSSLNTITYGTEVMPEGTLKRMNEALPHVKMLQTYGLSEVGILRSKSKSSDSLWVKIGGEGFETRIVDGLLEIKAQSAMLGYLNAPSPFTEDGWFKTGDACEVDGEYLRILGRKSEIINVGGEKVFPAEVEDAVQALEGVEDVSVRGEPHPLTGNIVSARVRVSTGESLPEFRKRMRQALRDKLAPYKIPQKVELVDHALHGDRFKKMRKS